MTQLTESQPTDDLDHDTPTGGDTYYTSIVPGIVEQLDALDVYTVDIAAAGIREWWNDGDQVVILGEETTTRRAVLAAGLRSSTDVTFWALDGARTRCDFRGARREV